MKFRHFCRRSRLFAAAFAFGVAFLGAFGVASGNAAYAASANDEATETSGGWDLSVTPVQSATIGAMALTALFTLSLLQRRRRG